MCFFTNERHKTYQTGFIIFHLGHAPGVRLLGAGGAQGVNYFFEHGHVAYQIDGDDGQNRTGDLGWEVKRSTFSYKVNFKEFLYKILYVFSQIKDRKHNFY